MENQIVALYVRVSTGHQVDKDSLPFQKKELRSYCKHILHIDEKRIEIFEDAGRSGKSTKRPAFERMMKKIRAGLVSHVVVYKIDRITRNLVDFSLMYDDFKYNHVTFISLNEQFDTSSAIGEAVLKIILIFAELERKLTSERVKDIMLDRALSGQWNGARMPYGWRWNEETQMPEHDPIELVFARRMYDLYEETKSSCKVRDYNNFNGVPTKRGGEWTSKTVADFIRNPMNKGDYRYNYRESARGRKKPEDEVIYAEGVFPPLVPPEQWERCNAIMDRNAAAKRSQGFVHGRKHCHIFSGFLVCGKCGAHFQAIKKDRARANGFTPSLYRCGDRFRKKSCDAVGCSDVVLGPFIFNYIRAMVQASAKRYKIKSPEELEHILLSDTIFSDVAGIISEDSEKTFRLFSGASGSVSYSPEPLPAPSSSSGRAEELKQIIVKTERAMERLKKAYLFADDAMGEKEYLETKLSLETSKIEAENELKALVESRFTSSMSELSFIRSASSFLLAHEIKTQDHIVYNEFAAAVDDEILREFLSMVIDQIVITDGRPAEITFKNGLRHRFLYRESK